METKTIKIKGMSCDHCVQSITEAVGALAGVESVKVSLENATAEVKYDPAKVSLDKIKAEIDDQGYEIAE